MPNKFKRQDRDLSSSARFALEDSDQRVLLRLVFLATGLILCGFAVLQLSNHNLLLATGELAAGLLLFWGCWKLAQVRNLTPWIYVFLLPTFCFLLYIMVMPNASQTAFVWIYMVPVLSYLLLGRVGGFLLATPFILLAALLYVWRFAEVRSATGLIDLGNAMLCGVVLMLFVHIYESRRAAAQRALERVAETDALTGVLNRGRFQMLFLDTAQRAARSHQPFCLVLLDVDHFKQVNDCWGHQVGDSALQHLCRVLQRRLRVTDYIGRLGGEEFGLLLLNTEVEAGATLVEDLRQQLADTPLEVNGKCIPLSATFGVAQWPVDGTDPEALYRCADQRLYRGKAYGRDRVISNGGGLSLSDID
ncbi:GGDEF domain-containing protein [Pseudomonas neustonica]|uniref:diguanylate cyclase n=1 Tax=Pseudomonas neustonica TaxID=2487346 RepID=A0ABX9XJQ3_9PSED|nr:MULTISPECIES: GGDEF domain-containing protein [Pseudomonas]ROZ84550.1 GGDEF domain-containing protein [Pseudomonas sp. SSM44]ROZ86353.1 GGDEF domain-containing protein [Pseudomonas neustonica]